MPIATRTLTLRTADGDRDVAVRLFAAEADDAAWSCKYQIDWPEGTETMIASGFDAIQSLWIALQMIGTDLYTSTYHQSGKLFFVTPGKGYGFPVPRNIRDLLIGDDAVLDA